MKLPNPHFDIKITQRSKRQSAVAGAAYQSGETLFSEYDQKRKCYSEKRGITYTEIMLPANAPPEYADRGTLWNAVEAVEKQWNAQLARRLVLALPKEVPEELYPQMVREYCAEHFVSKGMCCDFAIHDTGRGNPHCHVMLTMRAIDEHGKWLPKSRKVYDLDENGERISLPSGNWKTHKEDTVDWNDQRHGEEWRHGWEIVQNRYLEMVGSPARVDLRSYERQGIDLVPTVHMGAAVTQMERRGIETNIGNLNRDIKTANRRMAAIRSTIKQLRDWIEELLQKKKELLAELKPEATLPSLPTLLMNYLDIRKEGRAEWSSYGQRQGTLKDMKAVSAAIVYLQNHDILTLDKLNTSLGELNANANAIRKTMRTKETRMKTIAAIEDAVTTYQANQGVHDKYLKIGWKSRQQKFAEEHAKELSAYSRADRFLRKQGIDATVNLDALRAEYAKLKSELAEDGKQLESVQAELKPLKDVRYWVSQVVEPEQLPDECTPDVKHSVLEMLEDAQSHKAEKETEDASRRQQTQQEQHMDF
jgi:hypothetical protein